MKRILSACLVLALLMFPGVVAGHHTPVATPDPFALPVNLLVLRIREGNGYEYVRDTSGSLLYENVYLVRDGEIADSVPPAFANLYEEHGVRYLYDAFTSMMPEHVDAEPTVGIAIQVRVATVPDGTMAGRLVDDSPAFFMHQAGAGDQFSQDITVTTDLPRHDQAITGFTGTDQYYGLASGDAALRVPFARFIAQQGTMVASIKVTSLDPAFNDALARELLSAQLACLVADEFCVPVPIPATIPYQPAAPFASPAARVPGRHMVTARSRV